MLLGRPASRGELAERRAARSASSTSVSSCAPRSMLCVPGVGLKLLFHGRYITIAARIVKGLEPHVRQRAAALRDPERGGDGRPRPRLAADRLRAGRSSSCCPRRSSTSARPGRRSRATRSSWIPSSCSSRSPRRRASSTSQARNPEHTVHIGGNHMVFSGVYGPPFVREGDVRRDAKMADFENFVKLAQSFPELDSPGGTISSPRTGRSTRATSTWSTRSRRCRTSPTGLGDLGRERARHDRHGRDRVRRRAALDWRRSRSR